MMRNGYQMLETTAGAVWGKTAPESMEDMYVMLPGNNHLSEIWDISIEKTHDGKITLFGNFPDTPVGPEHTVYFTDFRNSN